MIPKAALRMDHLGSDGSERESAFFFDAEGRVVYA